MTSSRAVATVKWFDHRKGFGFLKTQSGDVLVHYSDIEPDKPGYKGLKEGQRVEYEPATTENGIAARHVVPV